MKKIIGILILSAFICSSHSDPNQTKNLDSTLGVQMNKRDSTVQILNNLKSSIDRNRKIQNQNLILLIQGQDSISNNLYKIGKYIDSHGDSLQKTIDRNVISFIENPKKQGCNIYAILGSIIGALLSGGVAIGIFMHGKRNEKNKEKQKLYDYGEELFTLIKNIVVNSKKQVELIQVLVNSIKEKPYNHGKYQRISINLIKRAQSFDTTLTFNTFKNLNLEKKSYIKFYSSIDYLYEVFSSIDDDYHRNNKEVITPLSNEFIKLRQQILTRGTEFTDQKSKEKDKDPLYLYIDKLVLDYYDPKSIPKTIDLKYDMEKLIRPLKEELLAKYRNYQIANELLDLTKQVGDTYATITQENTNLSDALESQIEPVNSMISRLAEIETELKTKYAN